MSFLVLDSASLDKAKWERLLRLAPQSTFYHSWAWCSLWEKSYDFCRAMFFVEEQGSDYIIGLPLMEIRKKRLDSFFSMPMGTYGGPVSPEFSERSQEEFILKIVSQAKSLRTVRFQIVDLQQRLEFLRRHGFTPKLVSTHLTDVNDVDLKGFLEKRGFQQAEKKGVGARKIKKESEVQLCYDLYLKTCDRHKSLPKYSQLFYLNIFHFGKDSDWLLWWVAEIEGRIIGYQINFLFKDQLCMWDAASEPESLSWRPNDYLMGQSLKWCQEHKVITYNLGGSPIEAEGLVHFKEQWGGQEKNYSVYEKTFLLGRLVDLFRRT